MDSALLSWLDAIIIAAFLLLSLAIGLYYRKEGGKNLTSFFLGGRNLPWYIAGLSMVATTFAADTPLAVAELVAQGGIAKNWLWWSFLFGGGLTTFFFSFLWRRSGVLTELEFITLRYSGKEAKFLRKFKAVYLGGFINAMIIGWVNLAMMTLLQVFFDLERIDALWITAGLMVLAVIYSTLSGLKGVAVTDVMQFTLAMTGCIILAILVVNSPEVGGISALKAKLPASTFNFFPTIESTTGTQGSAHLFGLTIGAFFAFVAVQWWSSWYPGSEPGGGGYVAQRMMSTRSEKDAVWATLLFQIGHYCIRPWPWILVGLAAIALYSPSVNDEALASDLSQFEVLHEKLDAQERAAAFMELHPEIAETPKERMVRYHFEPRFGFVYTIRDFMPSGLRGLLLAAFIAAYLSTISTQVNWGASYLVNDLILFGRESKNAIMISRIVSVGIMVGAVIVTPFMTSISGIWEFIMQCGAGLGLVLIMRWYWWRVTAWAEIAATMVPLLIYTVLKLLPEGVFSESFEANYGSYYLIVGVTTISWLAVAFLTAKPNDGHLQTFAERVRPMGIWPKTLHGFTGDNSNLWSLLGCWLSATAIVLGFLIGVGKLLLEEYLPASGLLLMGLLSVFVLRFFLKKTNIFERNSESA